MSGIRQVNKREILLPVVNVSAAVPPHTLAATAIVARTTAPVPGRVKALVVAVAVVGIAGDSVDHKQVMRCRNAGFDGTGTTLITDDAVLKDVTATPDVLPAVGTVIKALGLASAAQMQAGEVIDIHHVDTGTLGTGQRAKPNIIGVLYEAVKHLDVTL